MREADDYFYRGWERRGEENVHYRQSGGRVFRRRGLSHRIDRCSSSIAVDSDFEVLRSEIVEASSRFLLYSRNFGRVAGDPVAAEIDGEEGEEVKGRIHEREAGNKVE